RLPLGRRREIDRRSIRLHPLRPDDLAVMSVARRVREYVALAIVEVVECDRVLVRFQALGRRKVVVVPDDLRNPDFVHAAEQVALIAIVIAAQGEMHAGGLNSLGGRPALELAIDVESNLPLAVVNSREVNELVSRHWLLFPCLEVRAKVL